VSSGSRDPEAVDRAGEREPRPAECRTTTVATTTPTSLTARSSPVTVDDGRQRRGSALSSRPDERSLAARDRPSPSSLAQRVVCAVGVTVEAGSARMQHGSRRQRAWFSKVQALGGEEVSAEQFWDGPTLYVRFSAEEPWYESPLMRGSDVPEAFVPSARAVACSLSGLRLPGAGRTPPCSDRRAGQG
jgi:hypothetical protein